MRVIRDNAIHTHRMNTVLPSNWTAQRLQARRRVRGPLIEEMLREIENPHADKR